MQWLLACVAAFLGITALGLALTLIVDNLDALAALGMCAGAASVAFWRLNALQERRYRASNPV